MGKLYLGADIAGLAAQLTANLAEAARKGDFFAPAVIVVPNHYLRKWLRLWLARRQQIAINLRFEYLETILWELLRELDPRPQPLPVELLDDDSYRLLILAALLDDQAGGPGLTPLREYLGPDRTELRRATCRRAWQLAVRLAERIKDYEYHRRDLILRWLRDQDADPDAGPEALSLERSQRRLFQLITREPDGLRALLGRAVGKALKTLPQYAGELLEIPVAELATPRPRIIHVFGFTQISAFHHLVLRRLGEKVDVRLYHLNPLIGQLSALPKTPAAAREALRGLAARYRQPGLTADHEELLTAWGQAGAEGLWLAADLLNHRRTFAPAVVAQSPDRETATVLHRLQDELLGRPAPTFVPQDRSLQVVACPGLQREVETVYHSILHNLQADPTLQQTEIGVLVTDMERYRPVVQAVFERQPRRLVFNIADLRAIGLSAYGHGVLGLLDLALEAFTRSRVFAVLLNPCFLAKLGVDRDQALLWLDWAEKLGIYHGWDPGDKGERGYPASPWYSWQLGLRRLRLGRLMDVGDEQDGLAAPRFQDVLPFADLASLDKEQLDTFCRAVEGLLPRLAHLRQLHTSGANWSVVLRQLVGDCLTVPPDRPEDQEVRRQLFRSLANLQVLDHLAGQHGRTSALPLALVREYVQHTLEALEGTTGEFLTGGVTIASLGTLLPVPFRILYVLGLDERLFPGTNVRSAFDLRSRQRCDGDIPPADANRFLFLQALLAAQDKLYLLYNSKELQRDQPLLPCSPVKQLCRYLERHVLSGQGFETSTVPLSGSDPRYLDAAANNARTDVFANFNAMERLLAIREAQRAGTLVLEESDARIVTERLQAVQQTLPLAAAEQVPALNEQAVNARPPTIALAALRRFLDCPAEAALRHHLRLSDDPEPEAADDEPFWTGFPRNAQLVSAFLHRFVARSLQESVDAALADWRERFAQLHEEWRLRGRVPEEAFGQADQTRFTYLLDGRLSGPEGLAAFLRQRQHLPFCGPILLGESLTPLGARLRFPALNLEVPARLVGAVPYVWRGDDTVEVLMLTGMAARRVPREQLSLPLLEPLLFFLALKAGTEPGPQGLASSAWLGRRTLHLHVAHEEGLVTTTYGPDDFSAEEARAYLGELVRDFLDRGSFDLLPFDLLLGREPLRLAYTLPDDAADLPAVQQDYTAVFQQAVNADQDPDTLYRTWTPMQLLEIVAARVPAEAFAKVRRRFRLLDRGPARLRSAGGGPDRAD